MKPFGVAALFTVFVLAGCANRNVWVHDTGDKVAFDKDLYWCVGVGEDAVAFLTDREYALFRDSYYRQAFNGCMAERGYRRVAAAEAGPGKGWTGGYGGKAIY